MRVVENTMPHDEKSIRIGKTVIPAHAIRWQVLPQPRAGWATRQ